MTAILLQLILSNATYHHIQVQFPNTSKQWVHVYLAVSHSFSNCFHNLIWHSPIDTILFCTPLDILISFCQDYTYSNFPFAAGNILPTCFMMRLSQLVVPCRASTRWKTTFRFDLLVKYSSSKSDHSWRIFCRTKPNPGTSTISISCPANVITVFNFVFQFGFVIYQK